MLSNSSAMPRLKKPDRAAESKGNLLVVSVSVSKSFPRVEQVAKEQMFSLLALALMDNPFVA